MDFKNKVIEHKIEKNVTGIMVWENNQFYVKIKDVLYVVNDVDSLIGAKILYSLPNNDYHISWTESVVTKPYLLERPDRQGETKFWSRYKPKMQVVGTLINDIFYDKSYSNKSSTKSKR